MPYAGICGQCPVFYWSRKELDVRQRLNKHKQDKDHTRKHYTVWHISTQFYNFCEVASKMKWWNYFVTNYIVRNIPPSPEARRHLKTIPLVS